MGLTPTVLLFDVDGTLIDNGGAGRRAMVSAFKALHGPTPWLDFSFAGMTDLAIVRGGLRQGSLPDTPEFIAAVLDTYLAGLVEEITHATDYVVFPGVTETLERGAELPHCAVGLGTGNVERGAKIKLARAGLNHYFSFGGFGSDREDRSELLRVGAGRGAALLQQRVEDCRVVVIGDTPRDVVAALAIGAECVGVGTGISSSPEELLACGATAAFANLEDEAAQSAIFIGEEEL
ncbi:MAG: haloacid dehalogenase-like hydrolase [Deltaproteobacteria bacterium]|nr:haloacid dehalogenase-like hydrolase [Deltaproteobacteria bacterium]